MTREHPEYHKISIDVYNSSYQQNKVRLHTLAPTLKSIVYCTDNMFVFPDIDECDDDNGGCEQNCNNTDGGFECYCQQGFSLGDDGTSCWG